MELPESSLECPLGDDETGVLFDTGAGAAGLAGDEESGGSDDDEPVLDNADGNGWAGGAIFRGVATKIQFKYISLIFTPRGTRRLEDLKRATKQTHNYFALGALRAQIAARSGYF